MTQSFYALSSTLICSPIRKLTISHHLYVFMEVSLNRHAWLNHCSLVIHPISSPSQAVGLKVQRSGVGTERSSPSTSLGLSGNQPHPQARSAPRVDSLEQKALLPSCHLRNSKWFRNSVRNWGQKPNTSILHLCHFALTKYLF